MSQREQMQIPNDEVTDWMGKQHFSHSMMDRDCKLGLNRFHKI